MGPILMQVCLGLQFNSPILGFLIAGTAVPAPVVGVANVLYGMFVPPKEEAVLVGRPVLPHCCC